MEIQKLKQTVYLPLKIEQPTDKSFDVKKGYFFTPEQLNQLLSDVIKDALETAADKADAYIKIEPNDQPSSSFGDIEYPAVRKKSITSTFDITYQKHKV